MKKPHPRGSEYPFVKAILIVGNQESGFVEFLVDTGAGVTTLSYGDSIKMDFINKVNKNKCINTLGVGGTERACPPKQHVSIALVDLIDPVKKILAPADYPVVLIPQRPKARGRTYSQEISRPSILGWNVLRYAKLLVDYVNKEVKICFESK